VVFANELNETIIIRAVAMVVIDFFMIFNFLVFSYFLMFDSKVDKPDFI